MKLVERLNKDQLRRLKQFRSKEESLSERDLKELMGVNRDTYKKVNGKWRKK